MGDHERREHGSPDATVGPDAPDPEETVADWAAPGQPAPPERVSPDGTIAGRTDDETTIAVDRPSPAAGSSDPQAVGDLGQPTITFEPGLAAAPRARPNIPGYEILDELGRGGMGVVYRARQVRLRRPCAVKMILAGDHADADSSLRFLAEAETIARLRHPNIVQIYSLGDHEGRPYFELEYVEGGSLAGRLDGTPWPPREAARLVEILARAMQEAHRLGIVHRDLKPANILLAADDLPKVSDFGLAKSLGVDSGLTRSESVLGTPSYMAPEQAEGKAKEVGPAADLYALGAILYELLTGRPPFRGATVLQTLEQVKNAEVVPPARLVPGLSRDVETIALVCLRKEPARRYASAEDLAEDLRRFRADEPIRARRTGPLRRAWRWCRRNPAVAGLLATVASLLMLLTVSAAVAAVWMERAAVDAERARQEAERARQSERITRLEGESLLTDMHTARGLTADERNDPAQALLWFANAARLAHTDPDRARGSRIRIRGWSRQAILPVHALPHQGPLDDLTFSADARYLLTSSREGGPHLWDLDRDEPLPWASTGGPPGPARLSPDGRWLARGGATGEVEIRAVPSGDLLQRIAHRGPIRALAFSPDGRFLALAGAGARVWDCRALGFATPELPHPRPVYTLAFSPTGNRLATGCGDGRARLFAVPSKQKRGRPLFDPVPHLLFSWSAAPDVAPIFLDGGRTLLTLADRNTLAWRDAKTGAMTRSWHKENIRSLAASDDARFLAVGSYLSAAVIDASSGAAGPDLPHRNSVDRVAFSTDGGTLLTLCEDLTARLWSVPDGKPLVAPLPLSDRGRQAAFSPDDRLLAVAQADGLVRIGRLPRGAPAVRRMARDSTLAAARLARDRPLLIDSRGIYGWELDQRRTRVYDVASGQPWGPYLEPGGVLRDAALAPDGRIAATVARADAPGPGAPVASLCFWDPRTGRRVGSPVALPSDPRRVGFSPDGTRVAVLCAGKEVLVVEADGGRVAWRLVHEANDPDSRIGSVHFTAGGAGLVTAGFRSIQVWDLATGRRRYPPLKHGGIIFGACLSHDARWLATGSSDGQLRVWDVQDGRPAAAPMRHADWPYQPVFSPDDRLIAVGCRDGTARVWDWRAGRLASPAMTHENEVFGLALTGDGRWLLTLTNDARLRAWDWRAGKPLSPPIGLGHGGAGWSLNVEITADGRDAVVGAPHASVALRLADLVEPDETGLDDLVLLAELAANQRLQQGEPLVLTTEEWLDRWHTFRLRRPEDAATIAAGTWEEHDRAADRFLKRGHPAVALGYLDRLVAAWPDRPEGWALRAAALGRLGRWDEAAVALANWLQRNPADHFAWFQSTPVFLQRGDVAGYRRHCHEMLERFGQTTDPVVAERISKACLFAPLPCADRDAARRLAERAVAMARAQGHWVLPWVLVAEGLADYRDGRFQDALARVDECLARGPADWNRTLPALLIRAMAQYRLGRGGEAREALGRADETFRKQRPRHDSGDLGANWHDWLICEALRREAGVLIPAAVLPADPFAP
jgi:WD40 repeat protein/tetratricopeptide (TPR) repeat protein